MEIKYLRDILNKEPAKINYLEINLRNLIKKKKHFEEKKKLPEYEKIEEIINKKKERPNFLEIL